MANPAECVYKDNNDGSVSDLDNDLQWSMRDSRQELGKWLNWDEASAYVTACNEQSYLGYNDWRLPTKSEVRSLFKNKNAYQTIFLKVHQKKQRKVSNYQAGGESSFWTSETRYDSYAWKSYYPTGKEICVDQTVSTTGTSARLVRDL